MTQEQSITSMWLMSHMRLGKLWVEYDGYTIAKENGDKCPQQFLFYWEKSDGKYGLIFFEQLSFSFIGKSFRYIETRCMPFCIIYLMSDTNAIVVKNK